MPDAKTTEGRYRFENVTNIMAIDSKRPTVVQKLNYEKLKARIPEILEFHLFVFRTNYDSICEKARILERQSRRSSIF